jgi:hypothetical protein
MKILKIVLKSLGILIVVLILAIITIPTLFRGKIESWAKKTINEKVNAQVDFNNLSITILRTFPNVTVSLEDIVVAGIDNFEGDTLANVKSFSIVVDIWALLKGDFVIKSIAIDNPYLNACILADGSANWDIMKEEQVETEQDEEESASDFKLSLKKFEITNANIIYDSKPDDFIAGIKNMNLNLSGELSAEHDILSLDVNSESVSIYSGNSAILSGIALAVKSKFDADHVNNVYTLKDNEIQINKMVLTADGTIQMPENGFDFNLTYGLKVPSLKSLLGLIPPTIVAEVNDIETQGDLSLNGTVQGLYNSNSMPVITLALNVKDGYIKYAGLSEAIKNLNIDINMLLDKNKDANSVINISKFGFSVMNNPFTVSGKVLYPFTDPDMNFNLTGKIDFTSLRKSMPLANTSLDGILNTDIMFAGLMSQIEKKQYEKITLNGNLSMTNFKMKVDGITPEINIENASLLFKPTICTLNAFDAKMGKSDLHVSGNLENMVSYVFTGSSLKGKLNLKSDLIDCNELLNGTSATVANNETQAASVSSDGVIILPSNIDFGINANINKFIYEKITMSNFTGNISVQDGKLNINQIASNTSGGRINITGSYAAQNTDKANVNMKLSLADVAIDEAAKSFDLFGKYAPILKDAKGKINFIFDFNTDLDKDMNVDYKTLNAEGSLKTANLELTSSENLSKLAKLLNIDSIKSIKNANLNFAIRNGMINVNPFDLKLGNIDMKIGGEHSMTNDLNYDADIDIPAGKIGADINNTLSKLGITNSGGNSKVKVGLKIKGTMTSPTFTLGLPKHGSAVSSIVGSGVTEIKETVKTTVDSLKNEAKEKVETIIDSAKNKAKDKITNKLKDLLNR